jgi:hypothetical protein
MAGMQMTGGRLVSDKGFNKGVSAVIDAANSEVSVFTATLKTRLEAVLVSNQLGSILPVEMYVLRDGEVDSVFISKTRVLKTKYMTLPFAGNDSRVSDAQITETSNKVTAEIILQPGDEVKFKCPIEDALTVTLTLREGIK